MNKVDPISRKACSCTIGLLIAVGCASSGQEAADAAVSDVPADNPISQAAEIDDYIRSIGALPVAVEEILASEPSAPTEDGDYMCTEQDFQETKQYDSLVAYAANSESLWPGALIRGDAVYSGLFTQLVFDRQPITISLSLVNMDGSKSAVIENPSLSGYRDALGSILASEVTGATPANIYWETEEVHDEGQLTLALGADVSWVTGGVEASFDFASTEVHSRYLVKYVQAYYTVDIDQPQRPSSFLADSVSLDEVQAAMWETNPPVYVSSITYGRMVLFTFESSYSSEELAAALDFAYSGGAYDVNASVNVSSAEILSSSKMTAYIVGGSGGEAAEIFDNYDQLAEFIQSGGDFSLDSPGAPIAYKLAYLKDNSPARLSFADEYTVTTCERVSQELKVTLKSIHVEDDGGDTVKAYGTISAQSDGQTYLLMDKDKDEAVHIDEGETWPSIGVISTEIVKVTPQPGSTVKLRARLYDRNSFIWDGLAKDADLGDESIYLPFEGGWRTEVAINLTGNNAKIVVSVAVEPI